jgi:coatomer subunit zeta
MEYLHKVRAILVLEADGQRVFSKYYDESLAPTSEKQKKFERALNKKANETKSSSSLSSGTDGDIMLFDRSTVLFKTDPELSFFVVGGADDNEIVLSSVLSCLYEALQQLLKCSGPLELRTVLENYDTLILVVDEIIDDGIILEPNPNSIVADVSPFVSDKTDTPMQAINQINKYLKQNL